MKFALLSLFSLFGMALFAQEEREVVVIRRDAGSSKHYKKRTERDIDNYNAFKFDPLRMAIGELNFSWEHRIGDRTTFEVEAGPTISNLGVGRFDFDNYPGSYNKGSLMGGLISAAVRYYPLEDSKAMNKLYVSPRLKYRRYNDLYTASPGTNVADQRGGSNEFIFSFNVGFQDWVSHNFAFDYYIGVGIGSFNSNEFQLGQIYDGGTNQWSYQWTESTRSYARFLGVIGLKVTVGN